jgi:hypothetical protein
MMTYTPEYRKYTCAICEELNHGWGNNPEPLLDSRDGTVECCDKCNEKVVSYRIRQMMGEGYGTQQTKA